MDIQFYKPEEIVITYDTTRIGTRDEGSVEVRDLNGKLLCSYYRGQIEDPDNFFFYDSIGGGFFHDPQEAFYLISNEPYPNQTLCVVTNNTEIINFMLAMINIGYGVEESASLMLEEKMLTTIEYVDTSNHH